MPAQSPPGQQTRHGSPREHAHNGQAAADAQRRLAPHEHPADEHTQRAHHHGEDLRALRRRLVVSTLLAVPVVLCR